MAIGKFGYTKPTLVQAFLLANHSNDIFLHGKSGWGKTRGLLMAALNNIDPYQFQTQCLVFCSTFDAAFQTVYYCKELINATGLALTCTLVSKLLLENQSNTPPGHDHVQILIGTPNELLEAAMSISDANAISEVYLDDADAYAGYKKMSTFFENLKKSTRLVFLMRNPNQTTFDQMKKWGSSSTKYMVLKKDESFNENIEQFCIASSDTADTPKYDLLQHICRKVKEKCPIGQIIIFSKVFFSYIYKKSKKIFLSTFEK